ncbi:hypothetical protein RhiJN_08155 [Ceratobasidium sp. AG-Ba]|nr:hypothetical protein RhiJN_08155 [Ceratobasidium sp. AG-Ba]
MQGHLNYTINILFRKPDITISYQIQNAHGIIFVHDTGHAKLTGTGGRNLRMFKKIVGMSIRRNVDFVTNKWLSPSPGDQLRRQTALEQKDEFFGAALKQGARNFHGKHDAQEKDLLGLLDMLLDSMPAPLQLQSELADGKHLIDTAAGAEVWRELEEAARAKDEDISELEELISNAHQGLNKGPTEDLEEEPELVRGDRTQAVKEMREMQIDIRQGVRKLLALVGHGVVMFLFMIGGGLQI